MRFWENGKETVPLISSFRPGNCNFWQKIFLILRVRQFPTNCPKLSLFEVTISGVFPHSSSLFMFSQIFNWKSRGFALLQVTKQKFPLTTAVATAKEITWAGFTAKCRSVYQSLWYSEEESPESLKTCFPECYFSSYGTIGTMAPEQTVIRFDPWNFQDGNINRTFNPICPGLFVWEWGKLDQAKLLGKLWNCRRETFL